MKQRILYIEDEAYLARIVRETLELKGYEVLHKKDGTRILESIALFRPDICILDVMLPHIDGFSLGSTIRGVHPRLPVIYLTAKGQTHDVLQGFSSGGTDYLKKPFSMEELMVRIDNQLRLASATASLQAGEENFFRLGSLHFYPSRFELQTGTESVKLSNRETEILNLLCRHQNQTIERRMLLQLVWGDDSFFNSRTLDVYIRKLREYLAPARGIEIITLKGKGYHFVVPA